MAVLEVDSRSIKATVRRMQKFNDQTRAGLFLVGNSSAKNMESIAKRNAKWTNRTGNARQRIEGGAEWSGPDTLTVFLVGRMHYNIWLELAMNRNWAILEPTLQQGAPELFRLWRRVIG